MSGLERVINIPGPHLPCNIEQLEDFIAEIESVAHDRAPESIRIIGHYGEPRDWIEAVSR